MTTISLLQSLICVGRAGLITAETSTFFITCQTVDAVFAVDFRQARLQLGVMPRTESPRAQTTIQKKQRAANQKNVKAANKKEGKATLRKRLESESESDVDEPSFSLQDTDESVGLDFSSSEDEVTDSFANAQPHTSTPHVNTTLEPMPCSSKQHPHPKPAAAEAIEIENLTNEEIRCEVGDFVAVRSWGSNPLD
ncbi:hypothetical protein GE061_012742 [Apolygus lucorum]|uniref:Uncharacterized protein n=1 Tax=Apolygus lucorum TaxID=248454 RepID=A0A8S9XV92_APOLU|nr:hypothetical protein GE061_012742 [Apolygus lucorum]